MLDMGFADDVATILETAPPAGERQMLLFSATTPPFIQKLVRQHMVGRRGRARARRSRACSVGAAAAAAKAFQPPRPRVRVSRKLPPIFLPPSPPLTRPGRLPPPSPARAQVDELQLDAIGTDAGPKTSTSVQHYAVLAPERAEHRPAVLRDVLTVHGRGAKRVIVFTETKRDCDELVTGRQLGTLSAAALHGDVQQQQRETTMKNFREGKFTVLVATDVAARGIDVTGVDLVISYHVPMSTESCAPRRAAPCCAPACARAQARRAAGRVARRGARRRRAGHCGANREHSVAF